ncbi:MAG: cpaB [Phycisphaerales bacterium]|nr:cpaB [Phycisphaerales bacterium]
MNWKAFTPLAIAVVLGLLAARLGMSMVSANHQVVVEPTNLVPVMVAARDIEAGTTLTEMDVMLAKVPPEAAPIGVFGSPSQAANHVAKINLTKGQAITPGLLADDGAGFGVGATLPTGYRAITVDISDTTGVAGFIMPKCKVDVVTTLNIDGKSMAKTVLESVTVLAVGSRINPIASTDPQQQGQQQPQSRTITLLVKPKDAEKVELAASVGRVRLVLRNGRDESVADSEGITLAELKGRHEGDPFADVQQASSTTQPSASPVSQVKDIKPLNNNWSVQVIKAGQVTTQNFDVPATPKATDAAPDHDGFVTSTEQPEHN